MQQKSVCAWLSICYSSVNEHVQRIAIDVQSKQGTTFLNQVCNSDTSLCKMQSGYTITYRFQQSRQLTNAQLSELST